MVEEVVSVLVLPRYAIQGSSGGEHPKSGTYVDACATVNLLLRKHVLTKGIELRLEGISLCEPLSQLLAFLEAQIVVAIVNRIRVQCREVSRRHPHRLQLEAVDESVSRLVNLLKVCFSMWIYFT